MGLPAPAVWAGVKTLRVSFVATLSNQGNPTLTTRTFEQSKDTVAAQDAGEKQRWKIS